MRKFSAGENPEGAIGRRGGAQRPLYDATSQIQKFWFSVVVQLFAGHIEPAGFHFLCRRVLPSVTSATEPSELDLKGVETEHQEQAYLLWAEQLSNGPNRMNIAPRRTPASKNYLPRASSAKS
jgi:hypothetical protein